ncbi:hypothetical protein [Cerasicoccus arenae]|uniref:hypothetical protein n=1 Tax=Cerasicoccus arenae TaxID=424488 RepID=UPI001679A01B|nr:hypothetical protein [Cerasicoccus arenae]
MPSPDQWSYGHFCPSPFQSITPKVEPGVPTGPFQPAGSEAAKPGRDTGLHLWAMPNKQWVRDFQVEWPYGGLPADQWLTWRRNLVPF